MRATTLHFGPEYETDNQKIWLQLKTLVEDSPVWTYIRNWAKTSDGRSAYFALGRQLEGQTAAYTRRNMAWTTLGSVKYTGHGKFSFDEYIRKH